MRDSGRVGVNEQFSAVLQGGGGKLVVPGGEAFLLAADFVRSGPDLILIGPDGQQVLIVGFFMGQPTDLVTEAGAVVDAGLVAKLAGPVAPGQFVQAEGGSAVAAIGKVSNVTGTVQVRRADGSTVELKPGDDVYQDDVVSTSKGGAVGLTFMDGTTFSLGSAGRMVLDEMVYDAAAQTGSASIAVMTGAFTLVSGAIPKMMPDAMQLKTPAMTIGIRGTGIASDGNTVALMAERGGVTGEITVTTSGGQTMTLSQPGMAATVGPGGGLTTQTLSPNQISQMAGNALGALPNRENSLSENMNQAANQGEQNQQQQSPPPPAPPAEQNGNAAPAGDSVQAAIMVAVAEVTKAIKALGEEVDKRIGIVREEAEDDKRAELDLLAEARRAAEAAAAARTKIHADVAVAQAAIAAEAAQNAAASLTDSGAAAGFAATAAAAAADAQTAYGLAVAEAAGYGAAAAAEVARAAAAYVAASADSGYAQGFAAAAVNAGAAAASWLNASAIQERINKEAAETTETVEAEQAKAAYDQALADVATAEQATYEPMILQAGTAAAMESRQLSFDSAYQAYYSAYVELHGDATDVLAEADIVFNSTDADPLVDAWLSGAVAAKLALADASAADVAARLVVDAAVTAYNAATSTAATKAGLYTTAVGDLTIAATALGVAEASEIAAQAAAQAQAEAAMALALAAVNSALATATADSATAAAKAEIAIAATTSAEAGEARDDANEASITAGNAATSANTALTDAQSALTDALNNTLPSEALFASAPASLQSAALQAYDTAQVLYNQVQAIQQQTAKLAEQAQSSANLAQQSYELLAVADIAAIDGAQSVAETAAIAAGTALSRAETAVTNALAAKAEAEALLIQLTDKYPSATALLESATQAVSQITSAYTAAVAARDRASIQNDTATDAKGTADAPGGTLESARAAAQAGATAAKSASTEASAAAAQASQASNLLAGARNAAAAYEVAAGRAADAQAAQAALIAATTTKTSADSAYTAALAAKNAAALALIEAGDDRTAADNAVTNLTLLSAGTADPHSLALATRALQQADASITNATKLLTIADAAVTAAAAKQAAVDSAYSTLEKAVASTVAASSGAQPTASHLATAIKAAEAVTTAAAELQRLAATATTAAADSTAQSLTADTYRVSAQAAETAAATSLSVKGLSDSAVAHATTAANAAKSAAAELVTAQGAAANAANHVDANPGSYNLATLAGYLGIANTALTNAGTAVTAATNALATAVAARDSAQALVATLPTGEAGTLARALADRATTAASQAQASLNAAQRDLAATQAAQNTAKGAYDLADGTIQLSALLTTMESQAVAADAAAQISVDKAIANKAAADAALATAQANLASIADLSGSPPSAIATWIDAQQAKAVVAVNSALAAVTAAETARLAAVTAKDAISTLVSGDNWSTANAAKLAADAAAGYATTASRQAQIAQAHAESAARAASTTGELKASYVDYVRDYNAQVAAQVVAAAKPVATADTDTVAEDGSVTLNVLTNDSATGGGGLVYAATGDGARITAIGTPVNGTATISGAGIIYTPKANFSGTESFTYTISNTVTVGGVTTTQTATATITVTITPVNDAPVVAISSSPLAYTEGASVAVAPGLTITDIDSATLTGATITLAGFVSGQDQLVFTDQGGITGTLSEVAGTLVLTLSGTASLAAYQTALRSVTFTNTSTNPDLSPRTIAVAVTDGTDTSAIASRTIAFTVVNDAPALATLALVNGTEDQALALTASTFTAAYSDPEGGVLAAIRIESLSANGTLKLNGTAVTVGQVVAAADLGNLTFVPNADWFGKTSFAWRATDGTDWSGLATFPIQIAPVNDAPVIASFDAALSVSEDGTASGTVVGSDIDNEPSYFLLDGNGDRVTARSTLNGSVTIVSATGEYVFTPNEVLNAMSAGETASDSFDIVAFDGEFETAPQTVGVTITGTNDAPVIDTFDVLSVGQDDSVGGTVAGSDAEADTVSYFLLDGNGDRVTTLTTAHGAVIIDSTTGGYIYTAGADTKALGEGVTASDSFQVVAFDALAESAPQTVGVTITGTNDAPQVVATTLAGTEDTTLAIGAQPFLDAFTDMDGDALASIEVTSLAGGGDLKLSGVVVTVNQQIAAADLPNLTFQPSPDWSGTTSFTWRAFDGAAWSATATYGIDIAPVADAPVLGMQKGDFLISTHNAGEQEGVTVLALSDGSFWTAWQSFDPATGDAESGAVALQRYDAAGIKLGGEVLVNSNAAGGQWGPDMAQLSNGEVVVVWQSNDPLLTGGGGIAARVLDADGVPGAEFQLNANLAGSLSSSVGTPSVAALSGGGFVAAWVSGDASTGDSSGTGIVARVFENTGAVRTTELRVNTTTVDAQNQPSVAALSGGGFVITWASAGDILAQRFDSAGAMVGGEFSPAETANANFESDPYVTAFADGGFVIVWDTGTQISARQYDSGGNAVTEEIAVNTSAADERNPTVHSLADGGYLVTWTFQGTLGGDASGGGIAGQRFDAEGKKIGGEFVVNSNTQGFQGNQDMDILPSGDAVIVWNSRDPAFGDSGSGNAVGRIIKLPAHHLVDEDGTVSGTVSAIDAEGESVSYYLLDGDGSRVTTLATAHGSVTIDSVTGGYTYTPGVSAQALNVGDSLADTFQAVAFDGAMESLPQNINVTVTGSDDAAVVGADVTLSTGFNNPLVITQEQLLANASDVDDTLSVSNLSAVGGAVADNLDGTWTVTPGTDFTGVIALTYDIVTSLGVVNPAAASIDVRAVNITGITNAGGALVFDGAALASTGTTGAATFEAWINPTSITGTHTIMSKGEDYSLSIVDGVVRLSFVDGNGAATLDFTQAVVADAWSHVAIVNTGTDYSFYVNGVAAGGGSILPLVFADPSDPLVIGGQTLADGVTPDEAAGFIGQMDDVRLWDVARTASEIKSSFQLKEPATSTGLIANWTMDSVENGVIPAANDGGPSLALGMNSGAEAGDPRLIDIPARAMTFDGYDDLITIAGEISKTSLSAVTLESWIRTDQAVNRQAIISFDDGVHNSNTGGYLFIAGGTLHFDMAGWGGPSTGISVADGLWHHVAAVLTDDGMLTLYVDGVAAIAPTDVGVVFDIGAGPVVIGASYSTGSHHFEGELADVRVWDFARTQADIAASMNTRPNGDEFGLLVVAPLDNTHLDGAQYVTNIDGDVDRNVATVINGPVLIATKPPSASDIIDVTEDTSFSGQILGESATTLTMAIATDGHPQHGWLWLDSDGTFSYRPGDDFVGTDSFTIIATDANSFSITKTFQINVIAVDDAADLMAPPAHENIALSLHGQAGIEIAGGLDTGTDAVTYEMWFNTVESGAEQVMLSAGTGLSDGLRLSMHNGQLTLTVTGLGAVALTGPFNDGEWHHVAASISQVAGTINVSLTANGTDVASTSFAGSYDLSGTTAYLGRGLADYPGEQFFKGELSDVRVNLGLRDLATIQADMQAAPTLPDATLVGWWLSATQSDMGTNTLTDGSGSGHTGTITGGNYGWNDRVAAVTVVDTALSLDGVVVYDPDTVANLPATVRVVIDAGNGMLTLGSTAGLTFENGSTNASALLTFTGAAADINIALASLTYQPNAGFIGRDSVSFLVDEMDATLTRMNSGTMSILVLGEAPGGGEIVVGGEIAAVDNIYLVTEAMAASGETFVIRNALGSDATLDLSALTDFERLLEGVRRVGDHLELSLVNGTSLTIENHFTTGQVEWLIDEDGPMRMAQGFVYEDITADNLLFGPITGVTDHVQGGDGDDFMIWQGGSGSYHGGGGAYNGVSFINGVSGVTMDLNQGYATIAAAILYVTNINEFDGTRFADSLTGSSANVDVSGNQISSSWEFRGYGGSDTFNGGGGVAFVLYDWALSGISLTVDGNLLASYAANGTYAAGTDTLIGILGIEGSQFADVLDTRGHSQFHALSGDAGDDTLYAGDYGSHLDGGTGRDIVHGGVGEDTFSWSWGGFDQSGTTRETTDVIVGFDGVNGDRIGLWGVAGLTFGSVAAQYGVWATAAGIGDVDSLLNIDTSGDAVADYTIWVDAVGHLAWDASWFQTYSENWISVSDDTVAGIITGSVSAPVTIDMATGSIYDTYGEWSTISGTLITLDVQVTGAGVSVIGNDSGNYIHGATLDSVQAGLGDDKIGIYNTDFSLVDGGAGIDVLAFLGGDGAVLDLTVSNATLTGLEIIDLSADGTQSLLIGADLAGTISDAVNGATGVANSLVILGVGDTVTLDGAGWTLGDNNAAIPADPGGSYSIYTDTGTGSQVFVENGNTVTANIIP